MKFSFCLFLLLASWFVGLEAAAQHNFILSGKITARDGSAMPQVTVDQRKNMRDYKFKHKYCKV